jgi:hypothetical integral membrane protein (TIGR02206 family)
MDWPISPHHFAPGSRAHAVVLMSTGLAGLLAVRAGRSFAATAAAAPGGGGDARDGRPRRPLFDNPIRTGSGGRAADGGTARRPSRAADAFLAAACVAAVVAWLAVFARDLLPDRRGWDNSLPLHLCDFVGLAVPVALWTGWRPARTLLYFWGLAFSSQAFWMPVVRVGPAHADFWLYWASHAAIVVAAAYDAAVLGYRPRWADWRWAVAATAVYAGVVAPLDGLLGANYGYVGDTGGARGSLVAAFGPWPGRVPVLVAAAAAVMAALTLPWEWRASASRTQPARTPQAVPPVVAGRIGTLPPVGSPWPATRAA